VDCGVLVKPASGNPFPITIRALHLHPLAETLSILPWERNSHGSNDYGFAIETRTLDHIERLLKVFWNGQWHTDEVQQPGTVNRWNAGHFSPDCEILTFAVALVRVEKGPDASFQVGFPPKPLEDTTLVRIESPAF
jgi:hypothetical protein